jgi:hypothetical protein
VWCKCRLRSTNPPPSIVFASLHNGRMKHSPAYEFIIVPNGFLTIRPNNPIPRRPVAPAV